MIILSLSNNRSITSIVGYFGKFGFLVLLMLLLHSTGFSQSIAQGFSNPIVAYQHLVLEKLRTQNKPKKFGEYLVIGSPFLADAILQGKVYATKNQLPIKLDKFYFDLYNQNIEVPSCETCDKNIALISTEVDSFVINKAPFIVKNDSAFFINGKFLTKKSNDFFHRIYTDSLGSLYKNYYTVLEIIPTNYAQGNLRSFATKEEYWYKNNKTQKFAKVKPTRQAITAIFGDEVMTRVPSDKFPVKDSDESLITIFSEISKQLK